MNNKPSRIPYFFFAFFAVIVAVNFTYIFIAKKTWTGLATENSYQKGLHYNRSIEEAKEQKSLGWSADIKYNSAESKKGDIVVVLKDKNSKTIQGAKVSVNFKRPTQEGYDFKKNLEEKDGTYRANISFPLRGQWDIEILAIKNQKAFQETKRYVIQ